MYRQYRSIESGEFFLIAGDCSQGGGDYNAVQFFSKTRMDVPLVYHSRGVAAQMTSDIQPVIERVFDATNIRPIVALERNNGGASEMERLSAMNHQHKYDLYTSRTMGEKITNTESNRLGWDTTSATRGDMCGDLKHMIDNRVIILYDQQTIDELYSFIKVYRAGKYQGEAEKETHDDLVMSLAIAIQLHQACPFPTPRMQSSGLPYTPDNAYFHYGKDAYE